MIQINQLALPAPSALLVQVKEKAGVAKYNTLGQLVTDGVQQKRQIEIRWTRMAATAIALLFQELGAGGFCTLVYPDPLEGNKQISCHVTERSARVWQYQNGAAAWADVALKLEER